MALCSVYGRPLRAQTRLTEAWRDLEGALTWAFECDDQPYLPVSAPRQQWPINLIHLFSMFSKMRAAAGVEANGAVALDEIVQRGVRGRPEVSGSRSRP